ncbi:hypothetical protein JST56_04170 [Candidatus Dependentiae bacterium]|jgi:Tfp pilus assembly protein PilN|nr:hypothetical protein [Candidatus Dependentiae bacterium]
MILFKKPSIYIEVTDATLTLAIIKHTRGKYHFKNIETLPLNKLDVINGIIFNPTTLFTSILKFIEGINHVPNKCNAIIALPILNSIHKTPPHCITLQAALCAAKTGLAVTQVIPTSLNPNSTTPISKNDPLKNIHNLLQPFQAQNKPPLAWCALGIMLLLASTALYCIEKIKGPLASLHTGNTHLLQLHEEIKNLSQADYKIEPVKKSMHEAQVNITKLQDFSRTNIEASPLLRAIIQHIPDNIILTTLELGKNKNKNSKKNLTKRNLTKQKKQIYLGQNFILTLKGLSCDADQIIAFNKALGSVKQLKNVRLTQLKQLKPKKIDLRRRKTNFRYEFTLQAGVLENLS